MMIDFITYILIASTFFYLGVEFGKILKPKLNPDNTIIIHPVEEKMYSREEVIQVIKGFDGARFAAEHMEKGFDTDKWIEENL